jgi:hypothetical protein
MEISAAILSSKNLIDALKFIRDADRALDSAQFKAKISSLIEEASDLRIALADAKDLIADKDNEISQLRDQLKLVTQGKSCPKCRNGRLQLTDEKPDPTFGRLGMLLQTYRCDSPACGFTRDEQFAPRMDKNK